MEQLIFATNNKHKVQEIRNVLGNDFTIITLKEAEIDIDIPEPFDTLEANASEKSGTIFKLTGNNCFSEDTGLFVKALNGQPGVKSARYAGESATFEENVVKLISNMKGIEDRSAFFKTIISLRLDGKEYQFEGICEGSLINAQMGCKGFGYDPVFKPNGSNKTFAQMEMVEKANFSHRRKAMDKLIDFLKKYQSVK
jgi:XTP/dITP diphosphohydrolase